MAPALTQTGEPPNLADTTCHTPDSNTTTPVPYENLKALSGKPKTEADDTAQEFITSESNLISNGDCVSSGLAPPACGWAEGRPLPNTSPCQFNMDEQSPLHVDVSGGNACSVSSDQTPNSNSVTHTTANMGLQSCLNNIEVVSSFLDKGTELAQTTAAAEETSTVSGNQNELLALVGRDFDNVSDIIDTLQRLASNPELLDAAARDLEPEATSANSISTNTTTTVTTTTTSTQSSTATSSHHSVSSNVTAENSAEFIQSRLTERQRKLERRRLFLLRRLRRVTARGLGMTVSSQIGYLTRHVCGVLEEERAKRVREEKARLEEEQQQQQQQHHHHHHHHHQPPLSLDMLQEESMKSMSTSDLISFVRRVEASNNLQRMNDMKARCKTVKKEDDKEGALRLPAKLCGELDTVASEMRAAVLTHLTHDSDATESSSGGESCDEDEVYNTTCNGDVEYKPIRERAFYKYCRRRGWIASKWMWLQAQIADLDYRIAQQQTIYSKVRKTKGAVHLPSEADVTVKGGGVGPSPVVRSPAHLDPQDPALTCIGSTVPRTVINGYHPPNKMEEVNPLHGYSNGVESSSYDGCARTFGVERIKRRRYVRPNVTLLKASAGLISNNSTNKIIKASPILCKCVPPLTCIICVKSRTTVRNSVYNNNKNKGTLPPSICSKSGPGAFSSRSLAQKLVRIDQCFHRVLSSHSEILQGELLSTTLKSCEWQKKALANKSSLVSHQKDNVTTSPFSQTGSLIKRKKRNNEKEHKRNGRRKHSKDDSKERLTLKLKKNMLDGENEKEVRETKRRKIENRNSIVNARRTLTEDEGTEGDDESNSWHVSVSGSAHSSPCPSPALPEKGAKGCPSEVRNNRKYSTTTRQKQNSTSNSYDINNIVIPYSMAASSRVELLQYKEIPTPKWRIIEIPPLPASTKGNINDEIEDISDESIATRHSRSEEDERKKYQHYHKALAHSRSTRSRRADSSGTNTPDHPLSPRPSEPAENSSVGSPPDTPVTSVIGSSDENTVLTLSLSSLQTSLLNSNSHTTSDVIENGLSLNVPSTSTTTTTTTSLKCQQKASSSNHMIEGAPAMRTRRSLSGSHQQLQQIERIRSTSFTNDEHYEKDRLSPFPSRNFPLDDHEYEDLVCESEIQTESTNNTSSLRPSEKEEQDAISSITIPVTQDSKEETVVTTVTDDESGRDSPLSELTDSAPEEDGFWDDGSSPDWTISAVNDHCGGYVLTVHKN